MSDDTHAITTAQPQTSFFLTPQDVQAELRISERLCYRLLRAQAIPNVRVGHLYRIRREDLDEALESGAVLEVSK